MKIINNNKNFIKIVSKAVVMLFILSIVIMPKTVKSYSTQSDVIGLKSSNMSMDEENYDDISNLTINKIETFNDNIRFLGSIDGEELRIEGKLYKSELNNDEIVVDANNLNNNFNIIFMSIVLDGDERDDFIMNHYNNQNILKLYLEKNNQFYV